MFGFRIVKEKYIESLKENTIEQENIIKNLEEKVKSEKLGRDIVKGVLSQRIKRLKNAIKVTEKLRYEISNYKGLARNNRNQLENRFVLNNNLYKKNNKLILELNKKDLEIEELKERNLELQNIVYNIY